MSKLYSNSDLTDAEKPPIEFPTCDFEYAFSKVNAMSALYSSRPDCSQMPKCLRLIRAQLEIRYGP